MFSRFSLTYVDINPNLDCFCIRSCVISTLHVEMQFPECATSWQGVMRHHRHSVPLFFPDRHVQFQDRQVVLPNHPHGINQVVEQVCQYLMVSFMRRIAMLDIIESFIIFRSIINNYLSRNVEVVDSLSSVITCWNFIYAFERIIIFPDCGCEWRVVHWIDCTFTSCFRCTCIICNIWCCVNSSDFVVKVGISSEIVLR